MKSWVNPVLLLQNAHFILQLGFLAEKTLRYLFKTEKKSKKRQILANRYEFLVYQSLANALNADDINCRESLKFRSFEDDLIDDKTWQQKEILIEQSNLTVLAQPIETHLQELEQQLEERLTQVNRQISASVLTNTKAILSLIFYSTTRQKFSLKFIPPIRTAQIKSTAKIIIN